MQSKSLLVCIRDGKTGKFVCWPSKEQCWLVRQKARSKKVVTVDQQEPSEI